MSLQFKNMNELVVFLDRLEGRISHLEEQTRNMHITPSSAGMSNIDERTIAKYVAKFMPLTDIIHPNFLRRAFAVWGHYFVANFIITVPVAAIMLCLFMTVLRDKIPAP